MSESDRNSPRNENPSRNETPSTSARPVAESTVQSQLVVSPADVVPDSLPGLGAVDDMVVLTLAMRFLERDLRAYCQARGYPESDYF